MLSLNRIVDIALAVHPIDCYMKSYHVTIAIKKNRVLSIGINKPHSTHPKNLKYNYVDSNGKNRSDLVGVHSELAAILKLKTDDCNKITFYVMRFNKYGKLTYSKPCSGCISLFNQVGYKDIFFSNYNGEFEKL